MMEDCELLKIIGQEIMIEIDRPLGSKHPRFPEHLYPINYGFVPGIIGGDGAEQDVYLLGVAEPVKKAQGKVIAVIQRLDDVETKWVAAPAGQNFTREEIEAAVDFQEKYFDSRILLKED
ncbi:inorganic diphosphatase [Enterococcus sp. HY326]|uniref:inorganic diphosphatase n=1 Tax=Enterococcus sp. HY326 TaxID=2971265 RepID=UPI00223FCF94|nr:inorganic diphosphatase [Enterococcus sp. HY326]